MTICRLPDRAIVHVTGTDAEELLNRLVTRNIHGMGQGEARFAALLSPQGKLNFDFLVYRVADGFMLDLPRALEAEFVKRLTLYKLRAAVAITRRDDLAVTAEWGDAPVSEGMQVFCDPRHPALGWRSVGPAHGEMQGDIASYRAHCVALGVPTGSVDYVYGDAFVHDANLDLLHGVDFDKGCYVGQEVVSRVHHRGSARKRIARIHFFGTPEASGAELVAGASSIGVVTSTAEHNGLAAIRIDRLEEAVRANEPVMAGNTLVELTLPTADQQAL